MINTNIPTTTPMRSSSQHQQQFGLMAKLQQFQMNSNQKHFHSERERITQNELKEEARCEQIILNAITESQYDNERCRLMKELQEEEEEYRFRRVGGEEDRRDDI
mmetsp:Transcript_20615/g.25489  ORF Transcript_20615/g.25489 Transcript_20615/m.25489 type:complete len:105 (+) Transcript_20615:2-316(+)